MKPLIYLAAPYSHKCPAVREARVLLADRAAAMLINQGYNVFSPLSHSHRVALAGVDPLWTGWYELDLVFMPACQLVCVLTLDGWEESHGIAEYEIPRAKGLGLPVYFRSMEDLAQGRLF